ncbi:MAG: hypothetical protein B7X86_02130 [Sphingobacteriales bacterium 17-39-43]|uniref:DUF1800 domain-containing protein n=1 Tax=Daejeonella sp. TaxID=2805397 RepID=UPI000BC6AB10|nr:DUF1800 domain-containing protein [Daejeonella sp.]OYZ33142.1 MAG: hypothetical protein B7Y24_02130 [Sphingobacteriales bacterium 16-39-50]OZA26551.1 MAG: hypothetical protein B7X86_02130 [Sphingobacteriales bacterium 17-39-43]OZA60231.1 MAG: hypothetical protein B7X75_03630 [Sphingobacteriales bacterium 39-40-5]HQS52207.1 DUF1800 domain-containing protein [Daejeonella sp.]HQT21705.1 DUF1800 domain-containing protein [Daejeonella sp.]
MKNILKFFYLPLFLAFYLIVGSSFKISESDKIKFPYKKAGLTERQAAAHLLNRFTFGARPGDIDALVDIGLEKWFSQQLAAGQKDDELNKRLSSYDAINLSNAEVVKLFPKNAQILRLAIKDGLINKDSVNLSDMKKYRASLATYMRDKGYRPQAELFRQLVNQKILRAVYSNNQLQEVLTDFWFNHFNVSITKNICAEYIPAYERDVIRPNVNGRFEDLLIATAKSPAMLFFLDNFSSSGTSESTLMPVNDRVRSQIVNKARMQMANTDSARVQSLKKVQQNRKNQGLNENYARELMELHTMGVDGGYTQSDVTQAARVLTGWSVYPMDNAYGNPLRNMIEKAGIENLKKRGFVIEGDFLFAANRHDRGEKVVLGKVFAANGAYEEGLELLKMLANHTSTAKFISRKLAVRFVNDNPSETLIEKMAETFKQKDGDISAILIRMVSSPEFWSAEAIREKTKSPFELAISAVRGLNADVSQPFQLNNWISRMGQKMYFYQAPTGFPDKGQYWINTGSLLNRMNFGLALAAQRIPGVRLNLLALNKNREPESSESALHQYSELILPERDLEKTIARLIPLLNDPELINKVERAASLNLVQQPKAIIVNEDAQQMSDLTESKGSRVISGTSQGQTQNAGNLMLAQVVGVILGSPEFQRK